jgi:hypothetical protein
VPLSPESRLVEPVAATPNDFVTARVVNTKAETADTTTLTLTGVDPAFSHGSTGQFAMVALPGFPAPPDLDQPLPAGRDRAHDPRRRPCHEGDVRPAAR